MYNQYFSSNYIPSNFIIVRNHETAFLCSYKNDAVILHQNHYIPVSVIIFVHRFVFYLNFYKIKDTFFSLYLKEKLLNLSRRVTSCFTRVFRAKNDLYLVLEKVTFSLVQQSVKNLITSESGHHLRHRGVIYLRQFFQIFKLVIRTRLYLHYVNNLFDKARSHFLNFELASSF